MTAQLNTLTSAVSDITSVAGSAITLLQNLSIYIKSNVDDPNALIALANQLETEKANLLAAINANPVPK